MMGRWNIPALLLSSLLAISGPAPADTRDADAVHECVKAVVADRLMMRAWQTVAVWMMEFDHRPTNLDELNELYLKATNTQSRDDKQAAVDRASVLCGAENGITLPDQ